MQSFSLNSQRPLGDAVSVEDIRSIDQGHNFSDSLSLRRMHSLPIERRDQEENIDDRLSLRSVTDINQLHQLQDTQEAVISHENINLSVEDNQKNESSRREDYFQKNIFLKNKPINKYKNNFFDKIINSEYFSKYVTTSFIMLIVSTVLVSLLIFMPWSVFGISISIGLLFTRVILKELFKSSDEEYKYIKYFYPEKSELNKRLWKNSIKNDDVPADLVKMLKDLYLNRNEINKNNPNNSLQYDIGILLKSMQESRQETNRIVKELEEGLKDADEIRKSEIEKNIQECKQKDLMNRISHYLAGGADTCTDRVRLTLLDALKVFADWHAERWLAQSPKKRDNSWNQDSFLEMAKRNANLAMAKEFAHDKIKSENDKIDQDNTLTQDQKESEKEKIEDIEISLGYYKLFSDNKLNLPFDVHAMQFTNLANKYITDDDKKTAVDSTKNVASNKEDYAKSLLKWKPFDLYLQEKYNKDYDALLEEIGNIDLEDPEYYTKCAEIGERRDSFFVNKVKSLLSENA